VLDICCAASRRPWCPVPDFLAWRTTKLSGSPPRQRRRVIASLTRSRFTDSIRFWGMYSSAPSRPRNRRREHAGTVAGVALGVGYLNLIAQGTVLYVTLRSLGSGRDTFPFPG
jgi:hypothetical protein